MAKKSNTFGKLLAFTTTAVAIGGTCYIFRDKIKQSSLYKTVSGKFSDIFGRISNEFCNDDEGDFFFDEEDEDFEDVFSENAEHGREYTSISINAKEDSKKEADTTENQDIQNTPNSTEENSPATDSISASSENSSTNDAVSSDENVSKNDTTDIKDDTSDNKDDKPESDKMISNDDLIEIFPKDSITSIKVGSTSEPTDSVSEKDISSNEKDSYENEGLSDVSEDPDTLEEQDKLDI